MSKIKETEAYLQGGGAGSQEVAQRAGGGAPQRQRCIAGQTDERRRCACGCDADCSALPNRQRLRYGAGYWIDASGCMLSGCNAGSVPPVNGLQFLLLVAHWQRHSHLQGCGSCTPLGQAAGAGHRHKHCCSLSKVLGRQRAGRLREQRLYRNSVSWDLMNMS